MMREWQQSGWLTSFIIVLLKGDYRCYWHALSRLSLKINFAKVTFNNEVWLKWRHF